MNFILAQVLGACTTIVGFLPAHLTNIRAILAVEIFLNTAATLNFLLLPTALSGFFISVFACVQTVINMLYRSREKKPPIPVCVIFSVIYAACALSTWSGPIDLLPAMAGVCFSLSVHQASPVGYRICSLCKSSSWLVYCFATGAYTLLFSHLFMILSIMIAIVRGRTRTQKGGRT